MTAWDVIDSMVVDRIHHQHTAFFGGGRANIRCLDHLQDFEGTYVQAIEAWNAHVLTHGDGPQTVDSEVHSSVPPDRKGSQ